MASPMQVPPALLLDRATIAALTTPADYLAAVTDAFCALAAGRADQPAPLHLECEGGGFHAKGAVLDTRRKVAALKLNANFPVNPKERNLPTIQGVILLCDAEDGRLLAVLDSAEITLRRTAAASALAASQLARAGSSVLAICGCGAQAAAQVDAIAAVLPIAMVRAWDADPSRSSAFAARLREGFGFQCESPESLAAATMRADVIVTCTTASAAFLAPEHVGPGAFVAAVGADSPHKSEIAAELMARSRVLVDSLEQCLAMGDLRHAVAAGAMSAEDVAGSLADLSAGLYQGRGDDAEVWIFDSTGVAIQDVASALLAYERAVARGAGAPFAFA